MIGAFSFSDGVGEEKHMGESQREDVKSTLAVQNYVPLKDLELTNHFLFGEVMCDPGTRCPCWGCSFPDFAFKRR